VTGCRWDRDREEYLRDDEPCKVDDYGDPTRHCTARRSCANHVGVAELTCARCVGRTRAYVRRIVALAPLMVVQALDVGVDSEAANLAGPACDTESWSWHKIAARQGAIWHVSLIEDDDDHHPYTVLSRWEFMLREDYDQPRATATSITSAGDYLDRVLPRLAQDDEQDFPLFAREMRQCRNHLESVLRNSATPEVGAPCPTCREDGRVVRMAREYGHYCDDPECDRINYSTLLDHDTLEDVPDTHGDRWVCPRNRAHWRSHEDYVRWIEERTTARQSVS